MKKELTVTLAAPSFEDRMRFNATLQAASVFPDTQGQEGDNYTYSFFIETDKALGKAMDILHQFSKDSGVKLEYQLETV